MFKVLANDGLDSQAIEYLENKGIIVETTHLDQEELIRQGGNYDVIIIRSATKMTREVLEALKGTKLRRIIRAGVGLDNVDLVTAQKVGIDVKNTPNASTNSVAELVLGHMLGLARFISISNVTMREGQWNKKQYNGMEIYGKTLGIIGFGRIGKALAEKAKALGMNIVFYDEVVREDPKFVYMELEDLLPISDFISLHTSSVDQPIINRNHLKRMKDGVFIINAARGNVIDEEVLLMGLESGKIAGAGLDVFCNEPKPNEAICHHPRVSISPHIGGSTVEAQRRIGEEVVHHIMELIEEEKEDEDAFCKAV
ncbi:MAG: D-2-hydroxyacid dehydrogenase [Tissierellia bacterium]|nr:D-2-hydroxyacid dehydrogenase [Tissierellia bacterium]